MNFGPAFAVAGSAGALGGLALAFALVVFADRLDPFFAIMGAAAIIGFPITIFVSGAFGALSAGWFVWMRGNDRLSAEADWLAAPALALTLGLILTCAGTGDNVRVTAPGFAMLASISLLAVLPGWGLCRLALHNLGQVANNRNR